MIGIERFALYVGLSVNSGANGPGKSRGTAIFLAPTRPNHRVSEAEAARPFHGAIIYIEPILTTGAAVIPRPGRVCRPQDPSGAAARPVRLSRNPPQTTPKRTLLKINCE